MLGLDRRAGVAHLHPYRFRLVGFDAQVHRGAALGEARTDVQVTIDNFRYYAALAYTVGGELVICGRIKDVIIVGGRNIYPQDIEKVVGEVEGVRTGNVPFR